VNTTSEMPVGGNGWAEYKLLILSTLEQINTRLRDIEGNLKRIDTQLEVVKVKVYFGASIISGVFGIAVALVMKAFGGE